MRVYSHYEKSFQDLPIMGKKTKVIIENRKFFCDNPDCTFTTFAEHFELSHYDGKPTKDYWDKPIKEDSPTAEHNTNVKKKMKVVEQVRTLRKQGFNKSEIVGRVGINRATVAKYLKND